MSSNSTSPHFFQTLIEKTNQAFFAYSIKEQRLVYSNNAFQAIISISEENQGAKELKNIVHPDDLPFVVDTVTELLEQRTVKKLEFRILENGEEEKWLCLNLSLLEEPVGEVLIVGHAEDVTQNRRYNDHLKRFSNKKNSVLNILTHDLAGPLGMIKNLSSTLAEEMQAGETEDALHILSLIERTSQYGSNLIQDFMAQEFLESSQTDLVTRRVNLVAKIQEAIEEYQGPRGELIAKRVEFKAEQEEVYAEIDDLKFLQVITNLISNSLKFTPDGGTITITLEEEEESVLVKVADTGVGIPEEFHASLFDKFTKARRQGLKGEKSVGMGMSICKTLVEWHQGQIWFESEVNVGTTFFIRLPKKSHNSPVTS